MRTTSLQWNHEKKNTKKNKRKNHYTGLGKICSGQLLVSGLFHSDYQAMANTKSPFYSYRWKQGWRLPCSEVKTTDTLLCKHVVLTQTTVNFLSINLPN